MTSTSVKVIWADFGSIFTRLTRNLLIFNPCAQDETRTHTILRPLPPQSSVYTNFTTCAFAFALFSAIDACPEQDSNLHTSRHAHLKRTRLPIPPSGQKKRSGKRDSNSRPRPWQGRALPTELLPQVNFQENLPAAIISAPRHSESELSLCSRLVR